MSANGTTTTTSGSNGVNGTNGHTDVITLFRQALWEVDQKKVENLEMETTISDLGLDSVAMLEVIGYLEQELDLHFPDEKLATLQTIKDLSDLIEAARN